MKEGTQIEFFSPGNPHLPLVQNVLSRKRPKKVLTKSKGLSPNVTKCNYMTGV